MRSKLTIYQAKSSPSKIEGAGGYKNQVDDYHAPQSLRDNSSILEEQLKKHHFFILTHPQLTHSTSET